jgi:PAS domain S-box-containing protein
VSGLAIGACRALVLAPHGRDAAVASALLSEIGIASTVCADLAALGCALGDDVALVVATEEAMRPANLHAIAAWAGAQPSWSDLPFIILTSRGGGGSERAPSAATMSETLGNVTFLERPFHPATFASVARTALKGRQRQYEARARLDELREGEERLRTALTAGRLGSWELDLDTRTLVCSANCKANFGRAADQPFSYEDLLASVHPQDLARMRAAVEDSIATGDDYTIEYRVIWPDGTLHWIEIRARVVADEGRQPGRLVGVSSDVTGRKMAEEDLRRLNETLEDRVRERTLELERAHASVLEQIGERERAEEQLRQAQKMEMIGQLTGGVAHDFNNLLMAVLGNMDLLRKHLPDDPKAARLIDGALQGAKRGAALTQRLLAFARRQDLRVEPVDLIGLVRGMADLLERSIGPGIDVRTSLPGTLPPALVDANQVELALLNLVVNARDAMPDGGVLSIQLDMAEAPVGDELPHGSYLRLVVGDTGLGMDGETLKRAIEPFFSTKELGKGTGLGLSMIHGLAVQLSGALRLASEPGHGTRAELWVPAATEASAGMNAPVAQELSGEAAPSSTILVVDDDALIAMSTVDMLEDLGHEVIEVNSGPGALQLLRDGRPIDLLITDYSMPGMTGVQLAKAAREMRPDLPILLATGYADLPQGSEIDLPRLGKPYQQDQLARQIAKLLNHKGARDESA